jgi:two-component system sensor histidine kinase UhpB
MRSHSLLTQVLAVNTALVAVTALVAAVVTQSHGGDALLLALAVASAFLLNSLLLRRRLEPMERLATSMDAVDLASPCRGATVPRRAAREVQRLQAGFNRMIDRLQEERREAGRAVLRAQEQERSRIAQDLHDEVNQALTGILLRLEATTMDAPLALRPELQETKRLANQAMEELLQLARQLRPTALDDHGLVPALASQVANFGQRTGIEATFRRHGPVPLLTAEQQLVVYRVCQESLSNIAQHAGCARVWVELSTVGRTLLRVRDDGQGFDHRPGVHRRGLGVSGMRERALLVGAHLAIFSAPGEGTTIELTLED